MCTIVLKLLLLLLLLYVHSAWHRQDLLQGGAKMEVMSWGTHDGL